MLSTGKQLLELLWTDSKFILEEVRISK